MGVSACGCKSMKGDKAEPVVAIDTTNNGLIIYYPLTDSIEHRCFDLPDPAVDRDIVFCCAAAFTEDYDIEASHNRICGDHVSGGKYYQRPVLKRNTGAFFVDKDGQYGFIYNPEAQKEIFSPVFERSVTAFTQEMMIHQGEKVATTRPVTNVNLFRALCQTKDGKLCIADAADYMPFGDFIQLLSDAGMQEALYVDMGSGWNYSWYREKAGKKATFIHPDSNDSATNWLVFHSI